MIYPIDPGKTIVPPHQDQTPLNTTRLRRLKIALLFLTAMLLLSAVAIVWGMVHYRIPGRLWRKVDEMREPIPTVPLDGAYHVAPLAPKLHFPIAAGSDLNLNAWREKARSKLAELLAVDWPAKPASVRRLAREALGDVTRETLVFTQEDGQEVPAFLLVPQGEGQRAGLVVVPGYSRGIVATAGVVSDFQNKNAIILARAGYAVLTMEVRGFGYLAMMGEATEGVDVASHVAYCLQTGRTALGLVVTDVAAGLSYLQTRPEVAPDRLGAVGFSSGGKAVIYLSALDERVRASVVSGCVMSNESAFRYSRHDSYEVLPEMGAWLELSDCIGLSAPRPMLIHWGKLDNQPWTRCAAFNPSSLLEYEAARRIYAASGQEDRLEKVITPNAGHEFDNESALSFLRKYLPPQNHHP